MKEKAIVSVCGLACASFDFIEAIACLSILVEVLFSVTLKILNLVGCLVLHLPL
jgi:hypothetical protein